MNLKRRIRRGKGNKAIVMLHGFGASMDDLFPLADYLDPDQAYDLIFPNAPVEVPIGPHMSGYAWFPLDMLEIERAMMSGTYRSYVVDKPVEFDRGVGRIVEDMRALSESYDEVILGGFSQGGMIASHLVLKNLVPASKVILMSTTLVGKNELEQNIASLSARPKIFISHGLQDPVLSPAIAQEFVQFLQNHNFAVTSEFFSGGHEIPPIVIDKLRRFIQTP